MFNIHGRSIDLKNASVLKKNMLKAAYLTGVSSVVLGLLSPLAYAQDSNFEDEIIATGIIQSLKDLSLIHISEPTRPY